MCGTDDFMKVDAEAARLNVSPGELLDKVCCSPAVKSR